MPARSTAVRNAIKELIVDFLHYDRKEDVELQEGKIEEAVRNHEISVDQIMSTFRYWLTQSLPDDGTLRMRAEAQVSAALAVLVTELHEAGKDWSGLRTQGSAIQEKMVEAVLAVKPSKVLK